MPTTQAASLRAEVWGSPIAHSLSPKLHSEAYRVLGISASYVAREVDEASLADAIDSIDSSFLGVSLTMPLKETVLGLVSDHRGPVDLLGVANTIVVTEAGLFLENTDPLGVMGALRDGHVPVGDKALILGSGATARSVMYALYQQGVAEVLVAARDRGRSERTLDVAKALGVTCTFVSLDTLPADPDISLVVSTLPHGIDVTGHIPPDLVSRAALFDVSYHPWPSTLATLWETGTKPVVSGLSMLMNQALHQVRWFVTGDGNTPLADEQSVAQAMRSVVGLEAV